ncbi:MAG: nickel-dependent hydrogenase large subunit [Defluviitaleaceae bacterium]|nr:nickel-dependent hydrogenase large subunit [Defluviitaleaceae bacterium]
MNKQRTIIPFGPQHPVLPEPLHLDLVLEGEKVVKAIPSIGFVHRGMEKLVEKRDYQEYVYVAERICGICSFMHGMGYCTAVEQIMGIEVPERAIFLRTMWAELSRVHSHILWLGLTADAIGFESLFMHSWRIREHVLDIFDMTTGGRVIFSVCKIGGVRKDIDDEKMKRVLATIDKIQDGLNEITKVFLTDKSIIHRLGGIGYLSKEKAIEHGVVGPIARGSGIVTDVRTSGYGAYPHLDVVVHTDDGCDSMARTRVRVKELFESLRLIRKCAEIMPKTDIIDIKKITGNPDGESFARLEQPRGEVLYYAKGSGTKFLDRMCVRTPTFANVPALLEMMEGIELADVPVLITTIDPCISCVER